MPAAKDKEEAAATEASEPESSEGGEGKYSREELLAESDALVGEPAYVLAGAFDMLGGTRTSLWTRRRRRSRSS